MTLFSEPAEISRSSNVPFADVVWVAYPIRMEMLGNLISPSLMLHGQTLFVALRFCLALLNLCMELCGQHP